MARAGVSFGELGGVAASGGPGLIGGLIVGSQFAKGIAIAHGLPYVAVNHLEAHALTARCRGWCRAGPSFPICCCWCRAAIASASRWKGSGATCGWAARWTMRSARLSTRWQSCWAWAGRAARRWRQLAAGGDPRRYAFPRPLLGRAGCDFSFSGLKTAVAQEVARHGAGALPTRTAADIAASFQRAVAEVLADRAAHAMAMMRTRSPSARLLVVAGGVAANACVRTALAEAAAAAGFALVAPPVRLVHGQRRDGRMDRHRAAGVGAGGCAGFRATAAVAAG